MSAEPAYILLEDWAARTLPQRPALNTLRAMARRGDIQPAPHKVGKWLYVERTARLVRPVPALRPLKRRSHARPTRAGTALYRHFDAGGQLLYVGVSLNALARLMEHARSSHWVFSIASITIEHHPTREAALAAEAAAIGCERPAFNIAGVAPA